MDSVRIRLIFEEERLLSESQRKNGLKRSWVLLKSHLHSISGFSSYLIDSFLLRDACPHGLTLSMDDFVLPPFEPISVLRDKDIVRVKKKDGDVAAAGIDVRLLANEERVRECSESKNEAHEDELNDLPYQLEGTLGEGSNEKKVCRKRKALKTLHSSKIKRNRYAPTAKCILAPSNFQQSRRFQQEVFPSEKSVVKKHKSFNGHTDTDYSNKKNASELQKCSSLKRDKRRQLMRKQVNAQKEKVPQKIVEKRKGKLLDENFEDSEQLAGRCDDEEVVSVVVRPGHFRFLPLGQVEGNQIVHPGQPSTESLCMNGMTIKKGKKCGKGKSSSLISNSKNFEGQSSKPKAKKGLATVKCPIDFDKLKPCGTVPKRGDIIAYRLIDLSSSWTPELSSFRVGKVSWCKPEANKIMLIPVRKYPFVFKKAINEESAKQVDTYPYAEDGTLKADYSSLVDIRIVEQKNSIGFKASGTKQSWNKWEKHSNAPKQSWNKWESHTTAPKQSWKQWENNTIAGGGHSLRGDTVIESLNFEENVKENAWDEILEALNTKKANFCDNVRWRRGKEKAWGGAHGS